MGQQPATRIRGNTSQRLVQQSRRRSSMIFKLVEYPHNLVAPYPFGFRELAHRANLGRRISPPR